MRNRTRRSVIERRVVVPEGARVEAKPEAAEEAAASRGRTLSLLGGAAALLLVAGVVTVSQAPTGASAGAGPTFAALPAPQADAESAEGAAAPVPVDPPVKLDVPQVGVAAAVEPLGLNPDGTMQVPADYAKAGWFTGLEAPGQVGTSVIVGHYDSQTGPAVFFRLRELGPGSEFVVTLAGGAAKTFVVDRVATYPKTQFPAIEVYGPSDKSSLRLVTCGGSFDKKRRSYRDNVVVYATEKEIL
ncbi:MAG TPA: class F sortase [Mycobacteriales bacterium]|nr:class F sortase [Mycobacteriales bacterium]